jgi:hypothetical protein
MASAMTNLLIFQLLLSQILPLPCRFLALERDLHLSEDFLLAVQVVICK